MHKKILSIVLLFAFSQYAAQTNAAKDDSWDIVGQGTMSVAFWDLYNAQLFAEGGSYRADQPFALEIEYLRPVNTAMLVKETKKQLKHVGFGDHPRIDDWMEALSTTWADVNKHDILTMLVTKDQHAKFLLNGNLLGTIQDPEFSRAFSSIWLSEKTSRPELRKQLLGYRE